MLKTPPNRRASMLKRMMGMENEDESDDEEPAKKIKGK